MTFDMSNFNAGDLVKLLEFVDKIKTVVPKVKEFLPVLKQWEQTNNIAEGELLIYTATVTNETVFLYVNKAKETAEGALITDEIKRFDLFEVLENISQYIPGAGAGQ